MDIRVEILRIKGIWTLTTSGPETLAFDREVEAIRAGIAKARQHNEATGGEATVHLWHGAEETLIFDTGADQSSGRPD